MEGNVYTVSGLTATVTGTDAGTHTLNVTGTPTVKDSGGNDVTAQFAVSVESGTLNINKRNVTLTSGSLTRAYNGAALTNETVMLGGDGFVSGEGATFTVTGSQTLPGNSANAFAYTLNEGTKADNYDITKVEGTLTVTNRTADGDESSKKYEITVTANSGEFLYDGTEHSVSGFTGVLEYEFNGVTYTVSGIAASASLTDAGETAVAITGTPVVKDGNGNDLTAQFIVNTINGKLTVNRRNVTLTSATDSKAYDGAALTNDTVAVGGDGWATNEGATYNVTGTQTQPGTSDNVFTYALNDGTKVGNYEISQVLGKLTVTNRTGEGETGDAPENRKYEITVTANSDTVTYDGAEHSVSGFETLEYAFNGVTYTVSGIEATAARTDAGETAVAITGTPVVKDGDGNDLTAQFIVNTVSGKLTVSKRNVTLTSATDSKAYDGAALTNDTVTVGGDGFADGEGATYSVTGTQTLVGTSENTFTYELNEGTLDDNYAVSVTFGTLTVSAREAKYTVTLTGNSEEYQYDGAEKTVTGYTIDGASGETFTAENDRVYTIEGMSAMTSGTDAGTYAVNVTGTPAIKDSDGNDVTNEFAVSVEAGALTIAKRNVTLTSATDSKTYDGAALTNDTVTVGGDGWASGEGAEYSVTGSRTLPGTADNAFTYTLNDGTKADNYDITTVSGKLTVTDRTGEGDEGDAPGNRKYEITIIANSGEFLYDGAEHSVSGFTEALNYTFAGKDYAVSGVTASAARTDAGETVVAVAGTPIVTDSAGNDLTEQFIVNTVSGRLTVNRRSVTLTSATDSKTYDGAALTNDTVTIGGDGFADGEGATYSVTGSRTLPGTADNAFTYTLNDGTKADNYDITTVSGKLTVTDRTGEGDEGDAPGNRKYEITIIANSGEFLYDGAEHSVSGFKTLVYTLDGVTYTVSGLEAEATGVDAGTYPVRVSGSAVVRDSEGHDLTAQFTVNTTDGTLTILSSAETVTIVTAPTAKTLVYTGEAQELVNPGNAVGGVMLYALTENGSYGVSVPTGMNAGDYTIWYRVDGDSDHEGVAPQSVPVTIRKASQTAPEEGKGYILDGLTLSPDTESANEKAGNETHYELYDGTDTPISGGSYTVDRNKSYYVRWSGSSNYKPSPYTEVALEVSVTAIASPSFMGGVSVTGVDSAGKCDAGNDVTVTATPGNGYEFVRWQYSDETEASASANYSFTATRSVILTAVFKPVGKRLASMPTAIDGLIYTGNTQTGITEPAQTRYTWTADSVRQAVNAGTYTATAVLEYGYVWTDGTDGVRALTWRIAKAPQNAPDGLTATDDSITGTTTDMECRAADARNYANVADGAITGLTPGSYYVRYKEDANHYPGDIAVVTVSRPTIRAVTLPPSQSAKTSATLNGYGSPKSAMTADYVSGVGFEYRKSGDAAWSSATAAMGETFDGAVSGLTADTDYVYRSVVFLTDGTTAYGEQITFHTLPDASVGTGRIEALIVPENPEDTREVIVSIEKGNDVIESKDMSAFSAGSVMRVSFDAFPDGNYNIVVRTKDGDFTETRMISVTDGSATQTVFTIPLGKIASIVEVKESDPELPTPKVAVEGLEEIITQEDKDNAAVETEDVEVKLDVENVGQNADGAEELSKLLKIDTFLDIRLFKTITELDAQGHANSIKTNNIGSVNEVVLEIAIPYSGLAGRAPRMLSYHNGAARILTSLTAQPKGNFRDGTFFVDYAGGYIFLYASRFSTYAISFDNTESVPTPAPAPNPTPSGGGSSGGGGGGSNAKDYRIEVADAEHGSVTVSAKTAASGKKITVTATPESGYLTDSVTVKTAADKNVTVTKSGTNAFRFTMPASDVTVSAAFVKRNADSGDTEPNPVPDNRNATVAAPDSGDSETDSHETPEPLSPDETGVSDWLITDEHPVYIKGSNFAEAKIEREQAKDAA